MPADATFNRLHDTIQTVTNFKGGYPSDGYHLYSFELPKENMMVTNDEEAYDDHQFYQKNKVMFEKRLKTMSEGMLEFEREHQERLKVVVRKPTGLKIGDYLEKHKTISYTYDFGDNWEFEITLEEIVDDYYFGFPTLLDGRGTAPPDDVGGLPGFYRFIQIYRNPQDPEHQEMRSWAKSVGFREYDEDFINGILKGISYKKTEWDKIDHDNYAINKDKYRKK